jgi:hypothetical protein
VREPAVLSDKQHGGAPVPGFIIADAARRGENSVPWQLSRADSARAPVAEESEELVRRQWRTEVEALGDVAATPAQCFELLAALHTFGDDPKLEAMRHEDQDIDQPGSTSLDCPVSVRSPPVKE